MSGMAAHSRFDTLPFIKANAQRGSPVTRTGRPVRPEPQLQPATTWAGRQFQICHIPATVSSRDHTGRVTCINKVGGVVVAARPLQCRIV